MVSPSLLPLTAGKSILECGYQSHMASIPRLIVDKRPLLVLRCLGQDLLMEGSPWGLMKTSRFNIPVGDHQTAASTGRAETGPTDSPH